MYNPFVENKPQHRKTESVGWLRKLTTKPIAEVSDKLVERFPHLHPDTVTIAGILTVLAGSGLVATGNPEAGTAVITLGSAGDFLDGGIARARTRAGIPNGRYGHVLDAVSDRFEELAMATARAVVANQRHDKFGTHAALFAAATNSLPSIFKAIAESQGKVVFENGRDPLEFMGTRVGRFVTGVLGIASPETNVSPLPDTNIPLQNATDALTVISNLYTSTLRLKTVLFDPKSETITAEKIQKAKERLTPLIAVGVLSLAVAVGGEIILQK
jgi:phosphatidylglycerophosphate synthase